MRIYYSAVLVALSVLTGTTNGLPSPQCTRTFCSTVTEMLLVDGATQQSETYALCMDSDTLNFKQVLSDGSATILNTEENKLYHIAADGETCTVAPPQEPTTINDLPFSMVDIDAAATIHDLNAKSPTSGVSSVEWFHDRPAEEGIINTPEELMHWYVKWSTVAEMVESSCEQHYDTTPGDGGNSTVQFGNRNFYPDWSQEKGSDPSNYEVKLDCTNGTVTELWGFRTAINNNAAKSQ